MPLFTYHARDIQGNDHRGTIETVDAHQAAGILGRKGLIIISIKQRQDMGPSAFDRIFNRVSFSDLVVATRQLATMIESGLVLSEALDILVEQQSNNQLKQVLGEVSRDIRSGIDLATAFRKHPDVFPPLYASLVKSGEQAGKLDVVLTQMATSLERDREFRSRVRGALIYPVMVVVMMFVVMAIMMFFVIPKLTSLYAQSNIELPLPTQILITISSLMLSFWWIGLALLAAGAFGFKKWVSTPSGKFIFDSLTLKVPVVGKIIQGTSLTNFSRTFGLLTTAGVPLLDALSIVKDVIENSVYKKALEDCFRGVERGLSLSSQLDQTHVFPKIISQMYRVGEETGKVDKVSFKMADYFESESDHLVKNLTVVIEPLILIVLGIGVAFLVLSIILPIYKLTTSFS